MITNYNLRENYSLLYLIYGTVTSRKGLLLFENYLYNFLNALNCPKNFITNKQILKRLQKLSSLILKKKMNLEKY